ncbi:MAG: hypothetical protein WC509_02340 [Candidatus Izemoplasmatales bacterium]
MKRNLIKSLIVAGVIALGGTTVAIATVNADSTFSTDASYVELAQDGYTVEEMLTAAIQDEYLAQATYAAIIAAYGEIRPFTNIIAAEQTHIDLLLPLFEAYGIEVPANEAAASVVLPESITAALSTGVDAETANIAMYDAFLAVEDLPEDVATVFTYLRNASTNHLKAFTRDRYNFVGSDVMNRIRNVFGKGNKGNGSKFGVGSKNGGNGSNGGYAGVCPNA